MAGFFASHTPVGKLKPTQLRSQSSDGEVGGSQPDLIGRLMAPCPRIDVLMGGITVSCLLDSGSMVSTIPESFFVEHFAPWGKERPMSCNCLQLRAANGLCISYIGYLEIDVTLCGKVPSGYHRT